MDNYFAQVILSDDELKELRSKEMMLVPRPVYAPAIVKAYFRGHPWKMLSVKKIAADTDLPEKQVRLICMRMLKEHRVCRKSNAWNKEIRYYWFEEIDHIWASWRREHKID